MADQWHEKIQEGKVGSLVLRFKPQAFLLVSGLLISPCWYYKLQTQIRNSPGSETQFKLVTHGK